MILAVETDGNKVWGSFPDMDGYMEEISEYSSNPFYGPMAVGDFIPLWAPDKYATKDLQAIRNALVNSAAKRIELVNLTIDHVNANTWPYMADDFVYEGDQTRTKWQAARDELFALRSYGGGTWPAFPGFPDGDYHW